MKKKKWKEAIKKNPRTKYLFNWEKKQAMSHFRAGLVVGIFIGAIAVLIGILIGYFL